VPRLAQDVARRVDRARGHGRVRRLGSRRDRSARRLVALSPAGCRLDRTARSVGLLRTREHPRDRARCRRCVRRDLTRWTDVGRRSGGLLGWYGAGSEGRRRRAGVRRRRRCARVPGRGRDACAVVRGRWSRIGPSRDDARLHARVRNRHHTWSSGKCRRGDGSGGAAHRVAHRAEDPARAGGSGRRWLRRHGRLAACGGGSVPRVRDRGARGAAADVATAAALRRRRCGRGWRGGRAGP
jgi:hypothetical protein